MYAVDDDGIIKEAQDAKNKIEVETEKEKEELNQLRNELKNISGGTEGGDGTEEPDIEGNVTQKGLINWLGGKAMLELETATSGATIQYQIDGVEENRWQTYSERIGNLDHGNIVYARLWNGKKGTKPIKIEIKDTEAPTVIVSRGVVTTNSITVNVTGSDEQWGMPASPRYSYFIKKSSESGYSEKYTGNDSSYTFTGLEQNTSYDIKVTTQDKAGNNGEGSLANITTSIVGDASGSITASSPTWNSTTHKASITLSTTTDMQIQWQKGGISGSWTTVPIGQNSVTIPDLNHGDDIYMRLWDGNNAGSEAYATVRDENKPNIIISDWPTSAKVEETIFATVTITDNESGINFEKSKYRVNSVSGLLGEDSSEYMASMIDGAPIQFFSLVSGTYYVHILAVDNAGNKAEAVSNGVTIKEPDPITADNLGSGSDSWEKINRVAKAIAKDSSINSDSLTATGTTELGEKYSINVGDIFMVQYDASKEIRARVLGFKHDDLVNTSVYNYADGTTVTKAGISFETLDTPLLPAMYTSSAGSGGWRYSKIRKDINGYTTSAANQTRAIGSYGAKYSCKNYVKQVTKQYLSSNTVTSALSCDDYMWILACSEIIPQVGQQAGFYGYARASEGEQYKYYKKYVTEVWNVESPNRVKYSTSGAAGGYWLRSIHYNDNSKFCGVNVTGKVNRSSSCRKFEW